MLHEPPINRTVRSGLVVLRLDLEAAAVQECRAALGANFVDRIAPPRPMTVTLGNTIGMTLDRLAQFRMYN